MTAAASFAFDRYGDGEWLMRVGPADGPRILLLPPLFEELNRTRALLAAAMRRLGALGFCCLLPDLPGTGESERPLETCRWRDWQASVRSLGRVALVASFRGGGLLDDAALAHSHWRFAPVAGASLRRDLDRSELAGGAASAGYPATQALLADLAAAVPMSVQPLRTVRLSTDAAAADAKLDGPALWRRSEPGTSAELADRIAADISDWAGQCGIC